MGEPIMSRCGARGLMKRKGASAAAAETPRRARARRPPARSLWADGSAAAMPKKAGGKVESKGANVLEDEGGPSPSGKLWASWPTQTDREIEREREREKERT